MRTEVKQETHSNFATLEKILTHYSLSTLTQDEITFLQLHCLEKLEIAEIAQIIEKETIAVNTIALKFLHLTD